MKKTILILLFLLLLAGKLLEADPIKISFLDNEGAIKQTTEFLLAKGCDQESVRSLRGMIDWYNSTPTDLDLKKFPPREDGFYSFQSVSNLVAAFSRPLIYTKHQNELNCFETAILLAGSLINTSLKPDEISGPFLPPFPRTNNAYGIAPVIAATPRDAYSVIYSSSLEWVAASKSIFSQTMQSRRICLTAAFDSYYWLPFSTRRENFGSNLLQVLQTNWKRQGIKFPENMEIVICYNAFLDPQYDAHVVSSHIGLLFRNREQYVFIEKLGTSAPYTRFDFKDKKDLLVWLRTEIEPIMSEGRFLLASFNDREVEDLDKIDAL